MNRTQTANLGSKPTCYSDAFFDLLEDDAIRSARVIVPILLRVLEPSSVIDVGCGRGAWLKAFEEHGISHVVGIDGDYVDRSRCLISASQFSAVDLSKPFRIEGSWELAVCLEVAEHLPFSMGPHLVQELTAAAPFVLFSAAIPGQGGTNHINEQWPSYWQGLFANRGFDLLDPIRRHIRDDRRVEWWYRQNIVLYASKTIVCENDALRREREMTGNESLEWIHARVLKSHGSVRGTCRLLPPLIRAALRRKLDKWSTKDNDRELLRHR